MEINVLQIIYQMINFGVVAGGLTFLLFKPVQKILDERRKRVEAAQKAASETMAEREEAEAQSEEIISEAKVQAKQITDEAKQQAQKTEQEILSNAQEEARNVVENAQKSWDQQKQQLMEEMKASFHDAVEQTAAKVVSKSIDAKEHKQLIEQELERALSKM
jgi:F-type H+-transporting ATPase subunit b